jgi:hypothetical protein
MRDNYESKIYIFLSVIVAEILYEDLKHNVVHPL